MEWLAWGDANLCGETFIGMYSLLYAMRIGADMRNLGKEKALETTYRCPSGVVLFKIRAFPLCNQCGTDVKSFSLLTRISDPYPKDVCSKCLEKYR